MSRNVSSNLASNLIDKLDTIFRHKANPIQVEVAKRISATVNHVVVKNYRAKDQMQVFMDALVVEGVRYTHSGTISRYDLVTSIQMVLDGTLYVLAQRDLFTRLGGTEEQVSPAGWSANTTLAALNAVMLMDKISKQAAREAWLINYGMMMD